LNVYVRLRDSLRARWNGFRNRLKAWRTKANELKLNTLSESSKPIASRRNSPQFVTRLQNYKSSENSPLMQLSKVMKPSVTPKLNFREFVTSTRARVIVSRV